MIIAAKEYERRARNRSEGQGTIKKHKRRQKMAKTLFHSKMSSHDVIRIHIRIHTWEVSVYNSLQLWVISNKHDDMALSRQSNEHKVKNNQALPPFSKQKHKQSPSKAHTNTPTPCHDTWGRATYINNVPPVNISQKKHCSLCSKPHPYPFSRVFGL